MPLLSRTGVMPYVPKVLPAVIPDPVVRRRAEEAFLSEDFKANIETYFVDNIKVTTLGFLNFDDSLFIYIYRTDL